MRHRCKQVDVAMGGRGFCGLGLAWAWCTLGADEAIRHDRFAPDCTVSARATAPAGGATGQGWGRTGAKKKPLGDEPSGFSNGAQERTRTSTELPAST